MVRVHHGSLEPPQTGGFLFGRMGLVRCAGPTAAADVHQKYTPGLVWSLVWSQVSVAGGEDGGPIRVSTLIYIIYLLLVIYTWLIVARALLSWFPVRRGSPVSAIRQALDVVTEPYLRLFRRLLPTARIGAVGLDLSALVGLVVLFIVIQVLARI
jgi:YggT family protein